MRLLLQRVSHASVKVDDEIVGSINKGLLVFFGVHKNDTADEIDWLANKLVNLRIFEDDKQKMNLSVQEVNGELLIVSQFTLYANCVNGRRPDFVESAPPQQAEKLYNQFLGAVRRLYPKVQTGRFAAAMAVELLNDGPVTIVLDSKK